MTDTRGFEIDFLPVGNGSRSGDAIAIRYGSPGDYKVLVYDGGTRESGQALVEHIRTFYKCERADFVVSSHPDADHASGLSVVLEQLEVGELWMHRPWSHSAVILEYFRDGRITDSSLAKRFQERMEAAYRLEEMALERGVPIREPFRQAKIGEFVVLSPERDWYIHELIAEFEKSPEQKTSSSRTLVEVLAAMGEVGWKTVSWVAEQWGTETLHEDVETSAENESSVIMLASIAGKGILLVGDAGVRALSATADFAEGHGFSIPNNLSFLQMPHHGSRHNVSTTVLDRILGSRKIANDGTSAKTAFASVARVSSTHPRKAVVNAFMRRGCQVVPTQGQKKCWPYNMPVRQGWVSATPLSFFERVEAWD